MNYTKRDSGGDGVEGLVGHEAGGGRGRPPEKTCGDEGGVVTRTIGVVGGHLDSEGGCDGWSSHEGVVVVACGGQ